MAPNKRVKISVASKIPAAIGMVEQFVSSQPERSGAQVTPLIREELLLRLLKAGW